MVAASPERHDSGLQANPVEVQSYQPPWKVLSDFALQSDIDQPAFQQLVSVSSHCEGLKLPQKGDSGLTAQSERLGWGQGLPGPGGGQRQGLCGAEKEASSPDRQASCESF